MDMMKIKKDNGPIVFLGSMNAMPMMYALELKKLGYEVIYFVDAPVSDKLCRPENHYPEIEYPYPDWIVEINIGTQIFIPFFSGFVSRIIDHNIKRLSDRKPQAFFLNGFFISLSPWIYPESVKIALSHGSDLDSWADVENVDLLCRSFRRSSIFKFLPDYIAEKLIRMAVFKQFNGMLKCDKVIYFPYGFNSAGDRVVDKLKKNGVDCLERYDISFSPLKWQSRSFKKPSSKLVVFSGVRFNFNGFCVDNEGYDKGNDLIIKGLAKFYEEYKDLEVHFVEKGAGVHEAKRLCEETGLAPAVIWHKEMKLLELLKLYNDSDICFDQLGSHWIGAIGGYALWLGRPLIANDKRPVSAGVWPKINPVCTAYSEEDVYNWMCKLKDVELRKKISEESKVFVERHMSPYKLLSKIFDIQDGFE